MSGINMDSDLAIYNATQKEGHAQGTMLTWPHPDGGQPLQVVYGRLKAPEVADWAERVRGFVRQVENDKQLRRKREREMREAEQAEQRPAAERPTEYAPPAPRPAEPEARLRELTPQDPLEALRSTLAARERELVKIEAQAAVLQADLIGLRHSVKALREAVAAAERASPTSDDSAAE